MQSSGCLLLAESASQLRRIVSASALSLAWAAASLASGGVAIAASPDTGKMPDEQLFSYLGKDPLPSGTIPWQLLRQVKLVEEKKNGKTTSRPEFSAQLKELNRQQVKVYGFVLPLSAIVPSKSVMRCGR